MQARSPLKAIVHERYGSPSAVLSLREVPKPVPGVGEVLLRVRATSVHPDIWHVVTGLPYVLRLMGAGLRRPRQPIPGTDVAGVVEAVGPGATRFAPGDEVFGEVVRGHQWKNGGTFAEYVAAPEDTLALKPACISFEQAACVPTSGLIALRSLRDEGRLAAGMRVLVNGAGGGVGVLAVQIARAFGAHVTAVDEASKASALRALGVDAFLDYRHADFTRGDTRYDLILDVASTLTVGGCRRVLTERGLHVLIGHAHFDERHGRVLGGMAPALSLVARSPFDRNLPRPTLEMNTPGALDALKALIEAGSLVPVVAQSRPLAEANEALRDLAQGGLTGRIVLTP